MTGHEVETALENAEPKEPRVHELGGDPYYTCHWMACGESLKKWWNYCPNCGQKINWSGIL